MITPKVRAFLDLSETQRRDWIRDQALGWEVAELVADCHVGVKATAAIIDIQNAENAARRCFYQKPGPECDAYMARSCTKRPSVLITLDTDRLT